jgi:hypothetical protein
VQCVMSTGEMKTENPLKKNVLYACGMSYIYIYIYIYESTSKARNLKSYVYGLDFLLGILLLQTCVTLIYA